MRSGEKWQLKKFSAGASHAENAGRLAQKFTARLSALEVDQAIAVDAQDAAGPQAVQLGNFT